MKDISIGIKHKLNDSSLYLFFNFKKKNQVLHILIQKMLSKIVILTMSFLQGKFGTARFQH
jgi:hypothetical protein